MVSVGHDGDGRHVVVMPCSANKRLHYNAHENAFRLQNTSGDGSKHTARNGK